MTGIHETAYPRLKGDYNEHDLAMIYAPTEEEWQFVREHYRQANQRAFVLVQLKLLQRLGYFVPLSSLPGVLVKYICNCVGLKTPNKAELAKYDQSGSKTLHHQQLRALVGIRVFAGDGELWLADQALQVAQTKQELPDIINVLVESLIQKRYELPGFSYLFRLARKSRALVNGQIYRSVYQQLSPALIARLDRLLENKPCQSQSALDSLKQEPKQPHVTAYGA